MMPGNAGLYQLPRPIAASSAPGFGKPGYSLTFRRHLLKHEATGQSQHWDTRMSTNHAALKIWLRQEPGGEKSNLQKTKQCFTSL